MKPAPPVTSTFISVIIVKVITSSVARAVAAESVGVLGCYRARWHRLQ